MTPPRHVCEDDEMNKKASILAKLELYNSYKKGDIKKQIN